MIGTEDQMLLLFDESALALSEIAPKHENACGAVSDTARMIESVSVSQPRER